MRGVTVWTLTAALALGAGADFCAAQEPGPGDSAAKGGLFSGWFGKKADAARPAPAKEAGPPAEEARPATVVETAAAVQAREKDALMRRLAVCDKLRIIALQSDPEDRVLERKADQLEERAQAIYRQRTARLPAPAGGGFQSDEQTVARHLGGAGLNEQAPPPPNLTLPSLEGDSGRTAARREQP
jgi:hypothetical protein